MYQINRTEMVIIVNIMAVCQNCRFQKALVGECVSKNGIY